jgi:hypothetical protein
MSAPSISRPLMMAFEPALIAADDASINDFFTLPMMRVATVRTGYHDTFANMSRILAF